MDRYTDQKDTVEKKISFDDQRIFKKKAKTIKGKNNVSNKCHCGNCLLT